ncbi:MAG: nitroreductase family protein [Clostridiales bacterium]|nr:nitroreductase family protein [Clostridiales bacterium]
MILIDETLCIGCGRCVTDCFTSSIRLKDGKAIFRANTCPECGHCGAICPQHAITMQGYEDQTIEYQKKTFEILPENLLNLMKFRRSCRHFNERDVPLQMIYEIIEAGRFAPTGANSQNVRYLIISDRKEEFRDLAMERLAAKSEMILGEKEKFSKAEVLYAKMWKMMAVRYKKSPQEDTLFYHAPKIVLTISPSILHGGIASGNMELMAASMGLGALYSGFTAMASNDLKEYLKLKDEESVVTALLIGWPEIKYQRTVQRKQPNIVIY